MTKLNKDVEQRFDEQFCELEVQETYWLQSTHDYPDVTPKQVKQFLAQELALAKEEGAREREKQVENLVSWIERTDEFINHDGGTYIRMRTLIKKIDEFFPRELTNPSVKEQ